MMNKFFTSTLLAMLAILVGCAVPVQELTPEQQAYLDAVRAVELTETGAATVIVPESDAKASWERTQVFISKYSSKKVQAATDVLIETYNPTEMGEFGYKATKLTIKDEAEIEVLCAGKSWLDSSQAKMNTKILAHYAETGELMPEYVNKLYK